MVNTSRLYLSVISHVFCCTGHSWSQLEILMSISLSTKALSKINWYFPVARSVLHSVSSLLQWLFALAQLLCLFNHCMTTLKQNPLRPEVLYTIIIMVTCILILTLSYYLIHFRGDFCVSFCVSFFCLFVSFYNKKSKIHSDKSSILIEQSYGTGKPSLTWCSITEGHLLDIKKHNLSVKCPHQKLHNL